VRTKIGPVHSFRCKEEDWQYLVEYSKANGNSPSSQVRLAIEYWIKYLKDEILFITPDWLKELGFSELEELDASNDEETDI
jgi:hypothetical protein